MNMKEAMTELSRKDIDDVNIQLRSPSDDVMYYKITYKGYLFGNFEADTEWEDGEMFGGFMKGIDAVEEDIRSIGRGYSSNLMEGHRAISKILQRWNS